MSRAHVNCVVQDRKSLMKAAVFHDDVFLHSQIQGCPKALLVPHTVGFEYVYGNVVGFHNSPPTSPIFRVVVILRPVGRLVSFIQGVHDRSYTIRTSHSCKVRVELLHGLGGVLQDLAHDAPLVCQHVALNRDTITLRWFVVERTKKLLRTLIP